MVEEVVKKVGGSLSKWDREVLGDLKQRIKKAKMELELCRRGQINQRQVDTKHLLCYKLGRLEEQHNVY
jgi:hypothetical protein